MRRFKEFNRYDGLGLAEQVRQKPVSPAGISEEAISRIERVKPKLSAVVTPVYLSPLTHNTDLSIFL
jgi:amidase